LAITCNDGYRPTGVTAECKVKSQNPEADVNFVLSANSADTVCKEIQCTTPTTSGGGTFKSVSGKGVTEQWRLTCNNGFMPLAANGLLAMCTSTGELASKNKLPSCVEAPSCDGTTVWKTIEKAEASNCDASMSDGSQCKATCESGYTATGQLTCKQGTLVGFSTCMDDADKTLKTVERTMITASFKLDLDLGSLTPAEAQTSVKAALAEALAIETKDIVTLTITRTSRRLAGLADGFRRLAGDKYEVKYEMIAPTDPAAREKLIAKASFQDGGVTNAFASKLKSSGITADVSSIAMTSAPATYTATIVMSESGEIVTPAPAATTTPAPAASVGGGSGSTVSTDAGGGDSSGGAPVGAIIGAIAGLVVIGIVGFLVWKFVIKKGAQE